MKQKVNALGEENVHLSELYIVRHFSRELLFGTLRFCRPILSWTQNWPVDDSLFHWLIFCVDLYLLSASIYKS